jgi:hypothetical protein
MKTSLTWTKGVFSNLYKIYAGGDSIGDLKESSFSQSAKGSIRGREYLFRTHGFFNQSTEIIDSLNHKIVGKIQYNSWRSKATITLNGKTINWKYDNVWNTQWSLSDSDGTVMRFNSSTTKGQIDAGPDDELLVLTGLFVKNYYMQMAFVVIFIAVIIPVLT